MARSRSLTYRTDHVLGVIDDAADAAAVARALVAAGFDVADVTVLRGAEGAERLEQREGPRGHWTRLLRAVQFLTMDQMPDFPAYVAALEDGRAVVAVKVTGREELDRARTVLEEGGGHFLNYFGRYSTEELSRWRGPELPLPAHLRR
ncbi:MAG: hypothetical protein ACJ77N_14300 [Chloroflexota bacterium]